MKVRLASVLLVGAVACGDGSGSSSASLMNGGNPPPRTKPGLPLPQPRVEGVIITLAKAEVHLATSAPSRPDVDSGWVALPLPMKHLNLTTLQRDPGEVLGELRVPSAEVTQIRLFIDPTGKNVATLADGTVCSLDVGDEPRSGIVINHVRKAADVPPGYRVVAEVGIDLQESQRPVNCQFEIDPVIDIERIRMAPTTRDAEGQDEK